VSATKLYEVSCDLYDGGPTYLVCAGCASDARRGARYAARRGGWSVGRLDVLDVTSSVQSWDRIRSSRVLRVRIAGSGAVVEVQS